MKVAFFAVRLLSSQSEQSGKNPAPKKIHFDHVNSLLAAEEHVLCCG